MTPSDDARTGSVSAGVRSAAGGNERLPDSSAQVPFRAISTVTTS